MKKINSYQLYDMFSKKINFSLFYVKVIVFVLLKGFIYDSKIIIILSIYSRLFVENRLRMIAVLFFLFRIQQHLRCALILYLSSITRLTTHSLSFFPIFKHMGQEVGLSLPEIYVLLLANITAVRDYLYLHCRELFSNQTFYFWTPCQSIFNRRSTINTKYDYNLGNTNKNLKKCRNNNFHIKNFFFVSSVFPYEQWCKVLILNCEF